jgi:class 3 adenylate cyclase/alpha-beta hydrolase superfamily lysophospholipase
MRRPETKYARLGRDRIAYQVFGEGPVDYLLLSAPLVSVDAVWENAGHLRSARLNSSHFRTIMLDHRGSGVSDTIAESRLGNLDDRVDDVLAVLEAVGTERVCVCGSDRGAYVAIKFGVEHQHRVDKLILINPTAKGSRGDGYDFGLTPEEVEAAAELARDWWGTGRFMSIGVPNLSDDVEFLARFERMGASPGAAAAFLRNEASIDVRPLLALITVPTLVAHTDDTPTRSVEESRYLAEHIAGARFFEGSSTTFYWGGGVLEEIIAFVSGSQHAGQRDLATVLFTDIVDSTGSVVAVGDQEWRQTLDFLDDIVASRSTRAGGRVVKQTGDGHLVEFARPGDAVTAALAICHDAPTLGLQVRAGVHTGEIERRESGDIGGLSVHIAARVAAIAGPGEVVVSRTVADLLGSGEHQLHNRGEHELKGVPGRWQLYTIDT